MFVKIRRRLKVVNTFTPNGDGVNDRWDILNISDHPGAVVEICNSSGQLIFRSVGYQQPWDGRHLGRPLPAGTYYYVIDPGQGLLRIAGYVTILR